MIEWVIIALLTGAATGYFWDEIKAWALRFLDFIVDAIDRMAEVISDGIVYLIKRGHRYYKRVEVYVRNVSSGRSRLKYREEEVVDEDIPAESRAQLNERQRKLAVLKVSTR